MNTLQQQIIGAWNLISFEQENREGAISYPLGKTAKGALYYLPDGHVSVHIMQSGRQETIDEQLYADRTLKYNQLPYLAYCGRYYIDKRGLIMRHGLDISLYPEWVGGEQIRLITLHGDQLQLSSDGAIGPQQIRFRLLWQRA